MCKFQTNENNLSLIERKKDKDMLVTTFSPSKSPLFQGPSFYSSLISAGFPSPADDYVESKLDLNKYVVKHPAATYFVRAASEAMKERGIRQGDLLVVDRSLMPKKGQLVIAAIDSDLEMGEMRELKGQLHLFLTHRSIPIESSISSSLMIWGVITHVLHAF